MCSSGLNSTLCSLAVNNRDLHDAISKFWEMEECSTVQTLSADEIACESNFIETTTRNDEGRFSVTLPLKRTADCLGASRAMAEKRFYALERRLLK